MTTRLYGAPPSLAALDLADVALTEFMHWQYLPVAMPGLNVRVPWNLRPILPLIEAAIECETAYRPVADSYVYVSARRGWATPENPLNRPGWHCDGFGTGDTNYVWWDGPGTRFITRQPWYLEQVTHLFDSVPDDHLASLDHFDHLARLAPWWTPPQRSLYRLTPYVIHATPGDPRSDDPRVASGLTPAEGMIPAGGCMRSFVKISFSTARYNLIGNSHNELFDYDWQMYPRDLMRNDPTRAQADFYQP